MTRKRKALKARDAWETDTRALAWQYARNLAVAIADGTAHDPAAYDLGIVLQLGEQIWHRCPAAYSWRTSTSWTEQRIAPGGHRATAREVTIPRTCTMPHADWLITNHRLATRCVDGDVISIYWTAITGLTVDLADETVTLDGTGSYHGQFHGPAIAPIAVAAVAACHGIKALLDHPALAPLHTRATAFATPRRQLVQSEWAEHESSQSPQDHGSTNR